MYPPIIAMRHSGSIVQAIGDLYGWIMTVGGEGNIRFNTTRDSTK